jgi:CheY-like chemotaxis protein
MATTTDPNTIFLMDDELFNIQWLIDFLEASGYDVYPTSNADEALEAVSTEVYRAAILDLNVPMASNPPIGPRTHNPVYQRYPGLYVAWHARNQGYRDRQVIIYSVPRDEEVAREASVIRCTYIVKGRPLELKEEIMSVLAYDPTQDEG